MQEDAVITDKWHSTRFVRDGLEQTNRPRKTVRGTKSEIVKLSDCRDSHQVKNSRDKSSSKKHVTIQLASDNPPPPGPLSQYNGPHHFFWSKL